MKRRMLNEYEKALIQEIEKAERYCVGDLEMNYQDWQEEEHLIGWYAMDYREMIGAAFPIEANGYDKKPIISRSTIEKYNVDVHRCFAKCHVYVCG